MISWNVTHDEAELIGKIAKRAFPMAREAGIEYDYPDIVMDLTACHANGNPLDLKALLDAPDADFGHDVFGVRRFINRSTGKLGGCFSPRLSCRAGVA